MRPVRPAELALARCGCRPRRGRRRPPAPPVRALPAAALVLAAACAARAVVRARDSRSSSLRSGCLGWAWGGVRLDALDRSALLPAVGTAGRAARRRHRRRARRRGSSQRVPPASSASTGVPAARARAARAPARPLAAAGRDPRACSRSSSCRAGPTAASTSGRWLRRQGVHVVLHVDEWRRRRPPRRARRRRRPAARRWLRALARRPGSRENGARSSKGSCSATTPALDDELQDELPRAPGSTTCSRSRGRTSCCVAAGVLALAWLLGCPRWLGERRRRSPRSSRTCSPSGRSRR